MIKRGERRKGEYLVGVKGKERKRKKGDGRNQTRKGNVKDKEGKSLLLPEVSPSPRTRRQASKARRAARSRPDSRTSS